MNISKIVENIIISKSVEDRLDNVLYELNMLIENYYESGDEFTKSYLTSIQNEELKANFKVEGYSEYLSDFIINNLDYKNPLLNFNDNFIDEGNYSEKNILDLHKNLMKYSVSKDNLGKYRNIDVYVGVGGHRPDFIPPSHDLVPHYMKEFVEYLNGNADEPIKNNPLIKGAIAHYLFVNIHPFIDGNGRISRMLQQSIIWKDTFSNSGINIPPICVSNEFDKRKEEYFSLENILGEDLYNNEAWNEWLVFNLDIVSDSIYEISKSYRSADSFYGKKQELNTNKTR